MAVRRRKTRKARKKKVLVGADLVFHRDRDARAGSGRYVLVAHGSKGRRWLGTSMEHLTAKQAKAHARAARRDGLSVGGRV